MASLIRSPFQSNDRRRANADILRPTRSRKRRAALLLCDIDARIPTESRAVFAPKHMHRFAKPICTEDTHFESVTRNPESRCRTADARRRSEKLRLSPYCCCCLPPQSERFPCIIDDSPQECKGVSTSAFPKILKVTEARGPWSSPCRWAPLAVERGDEAGENGADVCLQPTSASHTDSRAEHNSIGRSC